MSDSSGAEVFSHHESSFEKTKHLMAADKRLYTATGKQLFSEQTNSFSLNNRSRKVETKDSFSRVQITIWAGEFAAEVNDPRPQSSVCTATKLLRP